MKEYNFQDLIGKNFGNGWFTNCHCRYRCFKGARNSKKSYDIIGYEVIAKILSDKRRNVLILRNTFNTHKNSTFATIVKIINTPVLTDPTITLAPYFKINQNDLTITYKPTGQVILFKGFDDTQKLTSIQVVHGFLTDLYVEEAFELDDYQEWRKVDGSMRANIFYPKDLFVQITFCFNAWSKDHWLYENFFKGRLEDDYERLDTSAFIDWKDENLVFEYGKGLYLHISTFRANEFRDLNYDAVMATLKEKSIDLYKVEGLGMWGNVTGATYPEFNDSLIIPLQDVNKIRPEQFIVGIDTGWSNGEGKILYDKDARFKSATTMQLVGLSSDYNTLYCYDEYFYSGQGQLVKKKEPEILVEMVDKLAEWMNNYQTSLVVCVDSADVAGLQNLEKLCYDRGMFDIQFVPSTKMKIQTRVDFLRLIMAFGEFKVSSACVNLIREIRNSRRGEDGKPREDFDDHSINANEYGWAFIIQKMRRWGQFKVH